MKTSRFLKSALVIAVLLTSFAHAQSREDVEKANKLLNEGNAAMTRGEFDAAIVLFTKVIGAYPDWPSPYILRGSVYFFKEDYELAIKDLDKALDLGSDLTKAEIAQIRFKRGTALLTRPDFERALADLNNALSVYPDFPQALINRGIAYKGLKQFDLAIADYSRAIELRPNNSGFHNRGTLYFSLKKFDKALSDFSRAIEMSPNFAESYHARALVFEEKGNLDEALGDYSKAISLDPQAKYLYNRAVIYLKKGQNSLAVADLTRVIEIYPLWKSGYVQRAYAYRKLGNTEKADADSKKAREVEKANFDPFGADASLLTLNTNESDKPNQ